MNLLKSLLRSNSLLLVLSSTLWFTILNLVCAQIEYVNYRECKRYYDQGDKSCKAKNNWCKYYFDCPPVVDKQWWESRREMCLALEVRFGSQLMDTQNPKEKHLRKCTDNYAECYQRFNCPNSNYDLSRIGSKGYAVRNEDADTFVAAPVSNPQSVACLVKASEGLEKAKCGLLTSSRTMVRILDEGEKIIIPDQFKSYRVLIRADMRKGGFAKESQLIRSEFLSNACSGGNCLLVKYTFMDETTNDVTLYTKGYYGKEGFVGRYFGHWICHGSKDHFGPSTETYKFEAKTLENFRSDYPFEGKCVPKRNMFVLKSDVNELVGVAITNYPNFMLVSSIARKSYNELNKELARPQVEG